MCVEGASAVLQSVLNDFPNVDISVSIVWIQMPGFNDNPETARETGLMFRDPRVKQFYDPQPTHYAGRKFAHDIITSGRGPAWDIYFFYDKEKVWDKYPPKPVEFMHQLSGGQRANPDRLRTGEALVKELHAAMHRLTGELCHDSGSSLSATEK